MEGRDGTWSSLFQWCLKATNSFEEYTRKTRDGSIPLKSAKPIISLFTSAHLSSSLDPVSSMPIANVSSTLVAGQIRVVQEEGRAREHGPSGGAGSSGSGGVWRVQATVAGSGGAGMSRRWVVQGRVMGVRGDWRGAGRAAEDGQRLRGRAREELQPCPCMVELLGSDAWGLWHTMNDA